MHFHSWKRLLVLLGLFALVGGASQVHATGSPTAAEIAKAIRDLGDNNFRTRERASAFLWAAGQAAEAALEIALKSEDVEVVRRAGDILDKFKSGIYPDTPPAVVELAGQFRSEDQNIRQRAIAALLKAGRPGYIVLIKGSAREANADLRHNLLQQIAREASATAVKQLADGKVDGAEELLEMCLPGCEESALRHYAAHVLLRGTIDEKIRRFQARADELKDKKAAELLAYLYRTKGDLPSARRAAEQSGNGLLLESILFELGDWKALAPLVAKKPAKGGKRGDFAGPALKGKIQGLAGNTAESEAELRKLIDQGEWISEEGLLFNDRPQEALAGMFKAKRYSMAFEFLIFQMKYGEAQELAEKPKDGAADDRLRLEILQGRMLYQLGAKDKALALFSQIGKGIEADQNPWIYATMVRAEYELGLKDLFCEHGARLIFSLRKAQGPFPWHQLFPKRAAEADIWWTVLSKKFPEEQPAAVLKRLLGLLKARKLDKDFLDLVRLADALAKDQAKDAQAPWLQALGETCLFLGNENLAQTYFEKAAAAPVEDNATSGKKTAALIRLADFLAEKKLWPEAADRYGQAWEIDRTQPTPLFLRGWCLSRSGQEKEGKKLMELAHWLPLANEGARYEMVQALVKHGLTEAVLQEVELLERIGEFHSIYVSNLQQYVEAEAVQRKDYFKAADCNQRIMLRHLHNGGMFLDNRAYVVLPARLHRYRAAGLIAAGRMDEGKKEIELSLRFLPGDDEVPILLVPLLEKQGHKKEAEDLFNRLFEFHAKLCKEHPQSGQPHNSLAWLAVRCHCRLEGALEHARKAAELEPKNASVLDTLAEVHFQRGDRAKAIELMKQCLDIDPKWEYFRKQLKRFEAGDPNADLPPVR